MYIPYFFFIQLIIDIAQPWASEFFYTSAKICIEYMHILLPTVCVLLSGKRVDKITFQLHTNQVSANRSDGESDMSSSSNFRTALSDPAIVDCAADELLATR